MNFPKKYSVIGLLSILSLCCAVIGSYLATGTYSKILNFNLVPFYLNYQQIGFVRRGLIGSFLHIFDLQNPLAILIFSYGFILIAAVLFWSWIVGHEKKSEHTIERYTLFVLSPALFLHFGYDLGRPDALNLIFLILGLYLIENKNYFIAGIIACLGILNHESFLFAFLPVMLAFYWYESSKIDTKNRIIELMLIFFTPFAADIFLTTLGGNNVDMDVVNNVLSKHIDAGGAQYYFVKFTSIEANIVTSLLNFYGSLKLNLYYLALLCVYLFVFVFYIFKFVNFNKENKKLLLSCFSPLFLLFLAIDKGRWFSMAIFNLCLISSYLSGQSTDKPRKPLSMAWATLVIVGLILGPMTVSGFDFASKFDQYFKEPRRIFQIQ